MKKAPMKTAALTPLFNPYSIGSPQTLEAGETTVKSPMVSTNTLKTLFLFFLFLTISAPVTFGIVYAVHNRDKTH